VVTYGIAVLIAPLVAILEYRASAGSQFAWEDKVWIWWVSRVAFEIVIVVLVVATLNSVVKNPHWAPAAVQGLVIGASVPAITRSYFFAIEKPEGTQKIGIALFYDLVVDFIEERIADIETEAESSWAQSIAYAALVDLGWTANTLAFRLADVAERRLKPANFAAFKEKLVETLREPSPDEQQLRETIAHARSIKAYRTLRSIVKKGEQPPETGLVI
jgi:hypothetical protein